MDNVIKKIINGNNIEEIIRYVKNRLFLNGPTSTSDLEILSYLSLYHPVKFSLHLNSILNYMSVFYKKTERSSLKDLVFMQYKEYILDEFKQTYTPVQADIIKGINTNKCFSFSAPTSTGKSFVFMRQIQNSTNDVVVVVPSRALINEYYLKLSELIKDRTINILTFIDKINTEIASKNIFIVTPERARELFKRKTEFQIDLFLFDEAQLSDEESKRGLYFDSIVRRSQKAYPNAKYVFAHPFVKNPESQIIKNNFNPESSYSRQYEQKNVGQMFLCVDKDWVYHHFGIDKELLGNTKQRMNFDPIERAITNNGSVLFFVSKTSIYNGNALKKFSRYIKLCNDLENEEVEGYIKQLSEYSGGVIDENENRYSKLISLLKKGIVIHHGSLPLQIRLIIEQFTKAGFCRICFATSTLEQGINMPFDVVFLDRLNKSKELSVKNLIGRAGRSSTDYKFDFGFVVTNSPNNMSKIREIMLSNEVMDEVSLLEQDKSLGDDYDEFKKAIIDGTYSDEFNLTENALIKLTKQDASDIVLTILNLIFNESNKIIDSNFKQQTSITFLELYDEFVKLYSVYLGRNLEDGEKNVFITAIKIIIWRIKGKTFKNICWYRYAYASKTRERRLNPQSTNMLANFITGYEDIPNRKLPVYSLFTMGTIAKDVSYDLVMYDTYDYIDKLIGFKLSDIFYASFYKYYEKNDDERALKLAQLIKYGTDDSRTIWMLRYGLSFEEIEVLDQHIETISEKRIIFRESIKNVPDILKKSIERFL